MRRRLGRLLIRLGEALERAGRPEGNGYARKRLTAEDLEAGPRLVWSAPPPKPFDQDIE